MKKNIMKSQIKEMLMRDFPPESVSLWKGIEQQVIDNKPLVGSWRWAVVPFFGMVMLALIMIFTPQGQVFAQNILKFFSRSDQSNKVLPAYNANLTDQQAENLSSIPFEKGAVAACGSVRNPTCSLNDVQDLLDFPLYIPLDQPDGMSFVGAISSDKLVVIKYEGPQGILLISEEPITGIDSDLWSVGKNATIESVLVNGNNAEYVQGAWLGLGIDEEGTIPWNEDFPMQTLRWQDENLSYTIVKFQNQSGVLTKPLDSRSLISIASSLHSFSLELNPTLGEQEDEELTIEEAEKKAGFKFIPASWLPDGFQADRVTYSSQNNAICQFYKMGSLSDVPALVIAQSNWELPSVETLQTKAYFGDEEVEIARLEKSIDLPGANNGIAELIETGLDISSFCGGNPEITNRALLWKKDSRSFILFFPLDANDGRSFTTINESQNIASGLNGFSPDESILDEVDPERLLSKDQVQEVAGFGVRLPSSMLDSVVFSHISYKANSDPEKVIMTQYYGQPVGDGRRYRLLLIETIDPENTLEDFALAGGFNPASVNGNSGIYQSQCWESSILTGGTECHQILIWADGNSMYEIFTHFPGEVSKEKIISIGESLN